MMTFSKNLMTSTVFFSGLILTTEFSFAADKVIDTAKVIKEIADTINKNGQQAACKSFGPLRKDNGDRCKDEDIATIAMVLCTGNGDKDQADFEKSQCFKNKPESINSKSSETNFRDQFGEMNNIKSPIKLFICKVDQNKFQGLAKKIIYETEGRYKNRCDRLNQNKSMTDNSSTSSTQQKISATASAAKEKINDLISKTSDLLKQLKTGLSKSKDPNRITDKQMNQLETLNTNLSKKIKEDVSFPETIDFKNAYDTIMKYDNKDNNKYYDDMTRAEGDELIAAYKLFTDYKAPKSK